MAPKKTANGYLTQIAQEVTQLGKDMATVQATGKATHDDVSEIKHRLDKTCDNFEQHQRDVAKNDGATSEWRKGHIAIHKNEKQTVARIGAAGGGTVFVVLEAIKRLIGL